MKSRPTRCLALFSLVLALFSTFACTEPITEIDRAVPATENLLVGSWAWVDASTLVVEDDLDAVQTSVFYDASSAPSSYTMAPFGDVLMLEGWFATSEPCAPIERCDQGRLYQAWFMTYYVDEEVFVPFAFEEVMTSGRARIFEAQSLRLDRLDPSTDALSLVEQDVWTLELDEDGRYHFTAIRSTFVDLTDPSNPELLEAERVEVFDDVSGRYALLDDALVLTPDDAAEEVVESVFRGGIISLDGLVFRRASR